MVEGVEMPVESAPPDRMENSPAVVVQMLGPLAIRRDGVSVALPASRKVRALLAYLTMAPHPISRPQLCELLWDVPNDPRGELRWCLSKLRRLMDGQDRQRVDARADLVRLDLADCAVDAREIAGAAPTLATLSSERLKALAAMFTGDFLEGLEMDRGPVFNGWLAAQRRRFRGYQAAVLEQLVARGPDEEKLGYVETWLELAPLDERVHELLLHALASRRQIREGDEHLAATAQLFRAEGLDCTSLRESWRSARALHEDSAGTRAAVSVTAAMDERLDDATASEARRASIAVMPFTDQSATMDSRGGTADALVHDVITRLAKLRSLFVIAQGSVFALHDRGIDPQEAGRTLKVDYVASGFVRRQGQRLTVSVELAETQSARIVWAEIFNQRLEDAFFVLEEIGNRIVASIAHEIETLERNRAILRPPNSLNAWEAHHRGLWHMYRFNRADNERAQQFFSMAVRLDPTFARAYAGLSFTHFQNAFQGWTTREPEIDLALRFAGQSLMADDRDPAAHLAVGRALWLQGHYDQAIGELEQAVELSPNFAMGHYTLAFVHSQAGDPKAAIAFSDHSRSLSPFDPLLFGMLGARAMALVRLGRLEEAASWAIKAAARPNAHAHIQAIAAFALALAGRLEEAGAYLAAIQRTTPGYRIDDFLAAMRFDTDGAGLFRDAANRIGMG